MFEFIEHEYKPFSYFGLNNSFFNFRLESIFFASISCCLLILILLIFRLKINKIEKDNTGSLFYFSIFWIGEAIYDFIDETIGFVDKKIFFFVSNLFLIILSYNMMSLLPYMEEPTKDLNTTIALAVYAFFMINNVAFTIDKKGYWHHWITFPIDIKNCFFKKNIFYFIEVVARIIINIIVAIVLFPFQLLEKLSLIFSLAFRLFGNIFGGAMVTGLAQKLFSQSIIYNIIGTFLGLNLILMLFFGFFEGLIQAFVFTLISLNNIGMITDGIKEKIEKKNKGTNI
jgi:F-type H+-transporting ATPase subunit a